MANIDERIMYTVSCYDRLFCGVANCGSYLTIQEAIAGAQRDKQRRPSDTSRYRIHKNPRGMGYVDTPVVLSLIGEMK